MTRTLGSSTTAITPATLQQNPEKIYRQLDKLLQKVEVSPAEFVQAIVEPYVERCFKRNPDYQIERLKQENERLRGMLLGHGMAMGATKQASDTDARLAAGLLKIDNSQSPMMGNFEQVKTPF